MEKVEPGKIDKSTWGEGPWQTEPDRIEWERHGLPCLMLRTQLGNWCGYVAVPPGHPAWEKNYESLEVDVHGGLTYADHCREPICHVPKPGEPDNVWWFGFDCAHSGDGIPSISALLNNSDSFFSQGYKDVAYVRKEVEGLADQLAALK